MTERPRLREPPQLVQRLRDHAKEMRQAYDDVMYKPSQITAFIQEAESLVTVAADLLAQREAEIAQLTARAIVAERHKALELMSRGSAAVQLENDLREKLALAELRAEAREAEIAALRQALQSIAANSCCTPCREAALVAQAALRPAGSAPTRDDSGSSASSVQEP